MVKDYVSYKKTDGTLENTIKLYMLELSKAEEDCGEPLRNLSQDTLVGYLRCFSRKGLTVETVMNKFYILLGYYNWEAAHKNIDANPLGGVKNDIKELIKVA